MNGKASAATRYRMPVRQRIRFWFVDRHVDWKAWRRKRRALRRWATPEEQLAYAAGHNRGAMLGILYCTLLACLLLAGILLAGRGL